MGIDTHTKKIKVILTADINCKDLKWKYYAEDGENTWGSKHLKLTTYTLLTQWIKGEKQGCE